MMWIGASQSSAAGRPASGVVAKGGAGVRYEAGIHQPGGPQLRPPAPTRIVHPSGGKFERRAIRMERNPLSLPRTRTRCGRIDPLISTLVGIVNWGRPVRYSALYRPLGTSNGHTPRHPPWCNFSFKKCLEYNATVLVHLVVQGVRSGTRTCVCCSIQNFENFNSFTCPDKMSTLPLQFVL